MIEDAYPEILRDPPRLLRLLKTKPERYWNKWGEERALTLFHAMALRVPAYKDFLKKYRVRPSTIKTITDFRQIPTIDKDNYLRRYPLPSLCWGGNLNKKATTISATSGSTGEPFYFPREKEQDLQYAATAELYLLNNFQIDKKSTLYIDCFGMGVWIGGVFTYEAIRLVAERGKYKLHIITPGIFKEETLRAVKRLGPLYDQILIGGYPPLVKDLIDDGIRKGVQWEKFDLGIIFSAEGFDELFRNYIIKKARLKNPYMSTLNHYGSVDLGTMAHETPLSIYIRRKATHRHQLFSALFGETQTMPTLCQYNPIQFYFESIDQHLICSSYSGIPLTRYDLKDIGGVIPYEVMKNKINTLHIPLLNELRGAHIANTAWHLPFVYIFERSDFIVKLYGANIYPGTIRKALQSYKTASFVTGKFLMRIRRDARQNQLLEINIELKSDIKPTAHLSSLIQKTVVNLLLEENSEYTSNYKGDPKKQQPVIVLWKYEDSLFFKPGTKQKWIQKYP